MLKNSPKILHINKRDFFRLNFIHIDIKKSVKGAFVETVFENVEHVACRKVF